MTDVTLRPEQGEPLTSPNMRRARRTSADVRELVLRAAREEFRSKGYDGTTTKVIAARAGVSETVIFNHFNTKTGLFNAALVAPLAELVAQYRSDWDRHAMTRTEQVTRFVQLLSQLGHDYRTVLLSALNRRLTDGPTATDDILDQLAGELHGLFSLADETDTHTYDRPATIAAAAGMVLGVTLLDGLLFPRRALKISDDRLLAEMTATILQRVGERPPPSG
jgi:AcrR family transcriptional regulator